jgi:diguanylate cyclase (GGDEF)-like protein/PAS domain S-box-containing protein
MERTLSEPEFHQLFERITDAYLALDNDWRCTWLNARACELFGRPAAALIGRHMWNEFPAGHDAAFRRACEQAMAEQRMLQMEAIYPPMDRWLENRIYPSANGLTIYFLDITERKRTERQLLQHDRMLSQAQQVAHVGSWEWDIPGNRVSWSDELFRIYGLEPAQHVATFEAYLALVHPHDRARVEQTIGQAAADHLPFEFEERIVRHDGSVRALLSRGVVEVDQSGGAIRMTGACRDITARKRAEQMEAGQHDILAGIAAQRPLSESLRQIALLHEGMNPGALCSLLLLDESGQHVLDGAAPSLPESYNSALHGLAIGEGVGSCGTAAWSGRRVVVADIAQHPYWQCYRHLALEHGLKACWSTPVLGSNGNVLGTFAVYFREVREPREDELYSIDRMLPITSIAIESEQLIRRLRERNLFFDMSLEIFCIVDLTSQRLVQFNPSLVRVSGYSEAELKSRSYRDFLRVESDMFDVDPMLQLDASGNRMAEFVTRCRCLDGTDRQLEWVSFIAPDGLVYAVARDITDRRRVEAELAYASTHDPVTGLLHHLLLEHALAEILRYPSVQASVLVVGLDRFQLVNASAGHLTGDDVLQRLAGRLQSLLGGKGRIARFAGDEFMVTVAGMSSAEVLQLAERLRAAVAEPIEGHDYRLLLTASVGITHSPTHGSDAKTLLRRAEAAMSLAKHEGRDRVCEFSVGQMQELEDRLLIGNHLRDAIRLGELELHYQPQHAAATLQLSGFEALLRWNCPLLGQVPPTRFIPIAEALGLMNEIGAWVLDAACRQVRQWLDLGYRDFSVAVNVSAQQLQRPGLVAHVAEALQRYAVPPAMLDIELTESSLMENVGRVRDALAELKALGVQLSLDDFGTGYSSLAYLKQFPIDKLKIDQGFVGGLPHDAADAAIVRTIIAVGHELHMCVSAEGVSNAAQQAFLVAAGCNELQGFHLGQPLRAVDAERRLGQNRA